MLGGGYKTGTDEQPCAALKRSTPPPWIQNLKQTCEDGKKLLITDSGLPGIQLFRRQGKISEPNTSPAMPIAPFMASCTRSRVSVALS